MSFSKKLMLIFTSLLLAAVVAFAAFSSIKTDAVKYTEILELKSSYPHKTDSFTQGLFFYEGKMYESVGKYSQSKLLKNIDLTSGGCEWKYDFDDSVFAEGSVAFNNYIYVLSWKENKAFVFNPQTLELESTYVYPRQGWGLTTDGEYLIASDGSSTLYFMNEELKDIKSIKITRDGKEISNINELEYIDGYVWANVWLSNEIIIINPENGEVEKTLDFTGLYTPDGNDVNDCLNGIAYNEETGRIYITGKHWDTLFEFELSKTG